ncbi:MAG: cytochrome c [Deltaproteobacteria bacterium]|nr:cytochrome c [Deltaproteobacteria bacterium]
MKANLVVTGIFISIMLIANEASAKDSPLEKSRGEIIYSVHCAVCHGIQGKGDGPSSAVLIPKPQDFTEPEVKSILTKDRMMKSIMDGKPGSQMEGWKEKLSNEDIEAVVEYIKLL